MKKTVISICDLVVLGITEGKGYEVLAEDSDSYCVKNDRSELRVILKMVFRDEVDQPSPIELGGDVAERFWFNAHEMTESVTKGNAVEWRPKTNRGGLAIEVPVNGEVTPTAGPNRQLEDEQVFLLWATQVESVQIDRSAGLTRIWVDHPTIDTIAIDKKYDVSWFLDWLRSSGNDLEVTYS